MDEYFATTFGSVSIEFVASVLTVGLGIDSVWFGITGQDETVLRLVNDILESELGTLKTLGSLE